MPLFSIIAECCYILVLVCTQYGPGVCWFSWMNIYDTWYIIERYLVHISYRMPGSFFCERQHTQHSSSLMFETIVLILSRFGCCFRCWQHFAFSGAQVDRRAWAAIRDLEMTGNPPPLGVATRAETTPQPTPAQIPVDRCRTTINRRYVRCTMLRFSVPYLPIVFAARACKLPPRCGAANVITWYEIRRLCSKSALRT